MNEMTEFERINSILVRKFNRELVRRPELMEKLPPNAHVVPLLEGNDDFNAWSRQDARMDREGAETVYAVFRFRPSAQPDLPFPQYIAEAQPDDLELQTA